MGASFLYNYECCDDGYYQWCIFTCLQYLDYSGLNHLDVSTTDGVRARRRGYDTMILISELDLLCGVLWW